MANANPDEVITNLALAAGRGDGAAASAFIRATQPHVRRFLVHLVGPGDAEDLTQETFIRALRSMPGFSARNHARSWLLSIARRVAVDHVRAARCRPRIAAGQDWQRAADMSDTGELPGVDDTVALHSAVRTLSRDRREAFVLTQVFGLAYTEAARACGCPVGTIRSRVARARQDLAHALGGERRSHAARITPPM
jgi:RNA polymerase sigma-70 factor, ECF subfamily